MVYVLYLWQYNGGKYEFRRSSKFGCIVKKLSMREQRKHKQPTCCLFQADRGLLLLLQRPLLEACFLLIIPFAGCRSAIGGVLSTTLTDGSASFHIFPGLSSSVSVAYVRHGGRTYRRPAGPTVMVLTQFLRCLFVLTPSRRSAYLDGLLQLHLPSMAAKDILRGINKPTDNGRHTLMLFLPVFTRTRRSRMKWLTVCHHAGPSVSLSVTSCDVPTNRRFFSEAGLVVFDVLPGRQMFTVCKNRTKFCRVMGKSVVVGLIPGDL